MAKRTDNDDPLGMMQALRNIQQTRAPRKRAPTSTSRQRAARSKVDDAAEKFTMVFAGYHSIMLEWAAGKRTLEEFTKVRDMWHDVQTAYDVAVREFLGG